jgi:hypothetical protein
MESMGHWNFDHVYIDAKATPEQRKALEAIAAEVLAPAAPDKRTIRAADISRTMDGKDHVVMVGPYVHFTAHLLEGMNGGAPTVMNPPFADPMHSQWSQGVTTTQTYNDDAKWQFANSNYMYNEFNVTSEDYEKFGAKMQAMMGKK